MVVSGLARGIDAAAHRGALENGLTVAVLGCGIDRDYPRAHTALAAQIAQAGLIVSEYPPGVEPAPWRFPARNRLVAGLALATVVVEARERSGALITADFALDEGREVLTVPGEITSQLSRGHECACSVSAPLPSPVRPTCWMRSGSIRLRRPTHRCWPGAAAQVRAVVADAPAAADELIRRTGLTAAELAAALVELELLGLVAQAGGLYREVMTRTEALPS